MTGVPVADGADVEVVVTDEDGFMCIRVTDAVGEVYGGRVPSDADDRDKQDAVYAASLFVAKDLHGRPRVVGFDDPHWVDVCARSYDAVRRAAA